MRTKKEIKEAIRKSIADKKKAQTENQIIFKGYGHSKI